MAGSVIAAAYGDRLRRFPTYVVAFLITGLPRFLVFALGAPLWVILAVSVVGGCASGFLNPVLGAVIFERIPAPLLGRVSSLNTALCWSLMPFGGILGGVLVSGYGYAAAVTAVGVAYFAATMAPTLLPRFREMERAPEAPVEVTAEETPSPAR
jgi:MFS family permease